MKTEPSAVQREMQLLEHNLQQLLMQKQSVQLEFNEVSNALGELEKTHGEVYRVMANVMIKADKKVLEKELESKKNILEMRLENLEKQEILLESKRAELRKQKTE